MASEIKTKIKITLGTKVIYNKPVDDYTLTEIVKLLKKNAKQQFNRFYHHRDRADRIILYDYKTFEGYAVLIFNVRGEEYEHKYEYTVTGSNEQLNNLIVLLKNKKSTLNDKINNYSNTVLSQVYNNKHYPEWLKPFVPMAITAISLLAIIAYMYFIMFKA